MPVRLMPSAINAINREQVQLWVAKPVDFNFSAVGESEGNWRYVIENDVYRLDPTKADSYGKTNFIDPSRTYPFDGNLETAGSEVETNSTSWVDADAGVDMSVVGRYMVLAKIGFRTSSGGSSGYVGLFVTTNFVEWVNVWIGSGTSLSGQIFYAMVKPRNIRAVKVMFRQYNSSYTTYCRTYELSLYKV